LRIQVTAQNTDQLQRCVDAAAFEIDDCIDRPAQAFTTVGWYFDAATQAADPGPGNLRMNKSNKAAVTALYVSTTDAAGSPWTAALQTDDVLRLYDAADSQRWQQFTLTGPSTDHGGWVEVPVNDSGSSDPPFEPQDGQLLTAVGLRLTPLVTRQLSLANRINVLRGVEWWKANDAAVGAAVGMDQSGVFTAPRSSFMTRHGGNMIPLKQQFGVA